MFWFSLYSARENNLDFAGKMAKVEMSIEGESHPKERENIEEGNIRDGDIWVNLNESMNDNQSEILHTTNYLKVELQTIKQDYKRIVKSQE